MPLDDEELEKLCKGIVILVDGIPSSCGKYDAGEHFAIVLSEIDQKNPPKKLTVAGISTTPNIKSEYSVPIPSYLGLDKKSKIYCDWIVAIQERQILKIGKKLMFDELKLVLETVRSYSDSKTATQNKKTK